MRDLMAALSSGVAARRCGSNITEWRAGARILYDSPLAIATPFNVCWAICAIESVVRPGDVPGLESSRLGNPGLVLIWSYARRHMT
jgi:hypothetical protein